MDLEKEVLEVKRLVTELGEKHKAFEEGKFTPGEFKTFQTKINERIDQLQTIISRPQLFDPNQVDGKADVEGAKEYKAAFYNYLRTQKWQLDEKAAGYDARRRAENKALVADAVGQILIPEELETEIMRVLPQINVIRGLANVRPTSSDRIRVRGITETVVGWGPLELGAVVPEATLVPTEGYMYVEDQRGLTKVGENELAGADVSIEGIISDSFSIKLADLEEAGFVNGTGHANLQPNGFIPAAGLVPTHALATAGAVVIDDLLDLIYACPTQYRRNGTFLMHSGTELMIRQLRTTTFDATHFGAYYWQPSVQAGKPATLLGYPCETCDSMPQVGDGANQRVVVFGDFRSAYWIRDRKGMTIRRMEEAYATAGLVGFLVHRRVAGAVARPDALRILIEP